MKKRERGVSPGHVETMGAQAEQQINKSIFTALSSSAVSVVESADQEGQIVWESRDQRQTTAL